MKQASNNSTPNFQPCQIVCLDHENTCLYADVIQVVDSRQICWVRPLMLTIVPDNSGNVLPTLYDLRQGADLVWPVTLFRPALDTEVIPLLMQLDAPDATADASDAHRQLSWFVHQVWQANQSDFQAS
ncbi:hypothetical protein H6H02_09315 [Coleofasciculus sp. FACHB-1120]|nr:hypothetical protein [Coleofasciculus sp. FACHB-1120]